MINRYLDQKDEIHRLNSLVVYWENTAIYLEKDNEILKDKEKEYIFSLKKLGHKINDKKIYIEQLQREKEESFINGVKRGLTIYEEEKKDE